MLRLLLRIVYLKLRLYRWRWYWWEIRAWTIVRIEPRAKKKERMAETISNMLHDPTLSYEIKEILVQIKELMPSPDSEMLYPLEGDEVK